MVTSYSGRGVTSIGLIGCPCVRRDCNMIDVLDRGRSHSHARSLAHGRARLHALVQGLPLAEGTAHVLIRKTSRA